MQVKKIVWFNSSRWRALLRRWQKRTGETIKDWCTGPIFSLHSQNVYYEKCTVTDQGNFSFRPCECKSKEGNFHWISINEKLLLSWRCNVYLSAVVRGHKENILKFPSLNKKLNINSMFLSYRVLTFVNYCREKHVVFGFISGPECIELHRFPSGTDKCGF